MSKKFHRDVWVGLVLLLFCAAVLVNAVQISGQAAYLPVALTVLVNMHSCLCFLSLSIILDFDILHIGLQPRYLCFLHKSI